MFALNSLGEARKQFKTCVNILSTIKNENNEKYLILRDRYFNECPKEDQEDNLHLLCNPDVLQSPGSRSAISEYDIVPDTNNSFGESSQVPDKECSPYRQPPPYKPPPQIMPHAYKNQQKYNECVDEFKSALSAIGRKQDKVDGVESGPDTIPPSEEHNSPKIPPKRKSSKDDSNLSRQLEREIHIENQVTQHQHVPPIIENEDKENVPEMTAIMNPNHVRTLDKQISVKEATKKFNKIASEEEASKITSPPAKKKPEKVSTFF